MSRRPQRPPYALYGLLLASLGLNLYLVLAAS